MKRLAAGLLIAATALATATVGADAGSSAAALRVAPPQLELNLVVGETRTIDARGVRNYSEGIRGIVDVKLTTDRSKFVVAAKRTGTTSLLLIHQDGSQQTWVINVFRHSPEAVQSELQQLLTANPGLAVRRVGTRFFVEGTAVSEAEVARIERIAALYPGQVESLVVQGAAPAAARINIRIDFFFVQYDKLSGYSIGVDWPSRIGGEVVHSEITQDFVRGTTATATASVIDQPLPALDVAAHHGWAKVLQQSTVITANGSEATFENGGEQNYAISAAQTATIQPIEHGLKVTVLPRLDPRSGELEIGVEADVAHLVPAAAGSSLPGRATSKLQTKVQMRLGQSLILSGIRTSARRRGAEGLPLLSEIPVLGVLFGSHRGEARDVESAVFLVPSAVETVPTSALELVHGALEEFHSFSGNFEGVDAYPKLPAGWSSPPGAAAGEADVERDGGR